MELSRKGPCTLAKIGREIAERRDFWVKKSRRLAIFGNRKFSIFCRVAQRQLEDQLDFPVINLASMSITVTNFNQMTHTQTEI